MDENLFTYLFFRETKKYDLYVPGPVETGQGDERTDTPREKRNTNHFTNTIFNCHNRNIPHKESSSQVCVPQGQTTSPKKSHYRRSPRCHPHNPFLPSPEPPGHTCSELLICNTEFVRQPCSSLPRSPGRTAEIVPATVVDEFRYEGPCLPRSDVAGSKFLTTNSTASP